MKRERNSARIALLLSLGVHALLALLMLNSLRQQPVQPPQQPQSKPITFDFIQLSDPPPKVDAVQPVTPVTPVTPKTRTPPLKVTAAPQQKSGPEQTGDSSAATTGQGAESNSGLPGSSSAATQPRVVNLFPSVTGMLGGSFGGAESVASEGRTIQNGPGEVVDEVLVAEVRNERAKRHLDGLIRSDLANSSRGVGLIDPWFVKALKGMRAQANNSALPESVAKSLEAGVSAYEDAAKNYARTGNPFGDAPSTELPSMPVSAGDRMNVHDSESAASLEAGRKMMASASMIVEQARKPRLETLIELEQTATGAVAGASILKKSGVPDFDQLALHRARKTFIKLEDAPDAGFGLDPQGFRTVWRFRYTPPTIQVDLMRVEKGHQENPFDRIPQ